MAKTASNLSGHMQKQLTRSLERIVEEAHFSGELKLSGRKLKDFPKVGKAIGSIKYNLQDTVFADLSKNRFLELPYEITEFPFLEKLFLYHNAIRTIPQTIEMLQSLSYIDLSRNQLTTLPKEICRLPLQTLLVAYNRLASLPEELGKMSVLVELDAGCNEITSLPSRMGDLTRLRCLNLRSNFLVHIPIEVTYLKLVKLDISGNRISVLPNELRKMKNLVDLQLLDNPLTSPPATLCIRGRTHIFKYLERQAVKHERTRGRTRRGPFEVRGHSTLDTRSYRRHNNTDKDLNTSEGFDRRWSQEINSITGDDEIHSEMWQKQGLGLSITLPHEINISDVCSGTSTPSTISPGDNTSLEDELGKAMFFEDHFEKRRIHQNIFKNGDAQKHSTTHQTIITSLSQMENIPLNSSQENNTTPVETKHPTLLFFNAEERRSLNHIQTYREYKEALRQQRASEGLNVYRSKEQVTSVIGNSHNEVIKLSDATILIDKQIFNEENTSKRPVQKVIPSRLNHLNSTVVNNAYSNKNGKYYEQDYKKPNSPIRRSSNILSGSMCTEYVPRLVKTAVGYVEDSNTNDSSLNSSRIITWNTNLSEKYSFTMRREFDRAKEEADLIEQLRSQIETRLKMALPEDLAPALTDGVVLCHLANYVRPRSVASIHVPSPAVPKLTMARCRRNVDNFLEACKKIGVDKEVLMDADAIMDVGYMEMYGLEALGRLISTLIRNTEESFKDLDTSSSRIIQDSTLSTVLFTTFIATLIFLYFFPVPD